MKAADPSIRERWQLRFRRTAPLGALLVLATVVVLSQNRIVGWEPGYNSLQPGHHGWVSSHTLAIISHATPRNRFVGYAKAFVDEQGKLDFDYFDRYPVFFSAGMHLLLTWKARLSTQIYLAKQIMNAFFVLTVGAAYLVGRKIGGNAILAAAAAILSVSSQYLLFYKDMVHFDQPALLGMFVLIYAIAHHRVDGRRRLVYPAAVLAVSMGRGYASFSVLLVWMAMESLTLLRQPGYPLRQRLAQVASHDSFRTLILGVAWGGLCLAYNIWVESQLRDIPPLQTSIVQSAVARLALDPEFNAGYPGILNWRTFFPDQLTRLIRWSFPIWNYKASLLVNLALLIAVLGSIGVYAKKLDSARRGVLALVVVSGPVWLIALRNLSAFHDYTAMYYVGVALGLYLALFSLLRIPRRAELVVLALSLLIFAYRTLRTQALHNDIGQATNVYTHDFMRIQEAISGTGRTIYLARGVPYAPYALGFYLPDQYLAPAAIAEYVIAGDPDFLTGNLTPQNSRRFLFRR